MKKIILFSIAGLSILFTTHSFSAGNLITDKSIGDIKIGMKYSEAIQILRNYKPKVYQESCESDAWSGVKAENEKTTVIAFSDNQCNQAKIIEEITTCSPQFKTKEGIKAGMLLRIKLSFSF